MLLGRNISRRREWSTVLKAREILKIQAGKYCPCNLGILRSLLGTVSVTGSGWAPGQNGLRVNEWEVHGDNDGVETPSINLALNGSSRIC